MHLRQFTPKKGLLPQLNKNPLVNYSEHDEDVISTVIQMISFINSFRYRNDPRFSKNFQQDVEFRENLAVLFTNKERRDELKDKFLEGWHAQGLKWDDIQMRLDNFNDLLSEFDEYKYFSHLTASEFAVVSLGLGQLASYVALSRLSVEDADIKSQLIALNDLLRQLNLAQYACMKKHLAIFSINEKDSNYQNQLPPSDILYDLYQNMLSISCVPAVLKWPKGLVVDESLLFAIPELPFEAQDAFTAKVCFENFIDRYEESLRQKQGVNGVINTAGNASYSLVSGAWWLTKTVVTSPVWLTSKGLGAAKELFVQPQAMVEAESKENVVKEAEEPEKINEWQVVDGPGQSMDQLEKIRTDMLVLQKSMQKMNQKYAGEVLSAKKYKEWVEKLSNRVNSLKFEAQECTESCFSFFYKEKISVKKQKIYALQEILKADNLGGLLSKVEEQFAADNRQVVFQGFFSRTEKLLSNLKTDLSTVLNK